MINKTTIEIVAVTNRIASFSCCLNASIKGYPKTRIPVIDAEVMKNIMNPLTSTKSTEDISSSGNKWSVAGNTNIKTPAAHKTYNSVPVACARAKMMIFLRVRFVSLLKKLMSNSPLVNDCL